MSDLQKWVRLPTNWIQNDLDKISWKELGSDGTSALMVLIALAHTMDADSGTARITYNGLQEATTLSRTKISSGLSVLNDYEIVQSDHDKQSRYYFVGYDKNSGWGKLPAKGLYSNGRIRAFSEFHLRRRVEFDALKLYLLFVARRDRKTNFAKISYDRISDYAGINRNLIKSASSFLAALGLVSVEHSPSDISEYGIANSYRLTHIDSYKHTGTSNRTTF